jgi:hypothetical protein
MRTSCSESDDLETIPLQQEPRRENVVGQAKPSSAPSTSSSAVPVPTARLSATFTRIIDLHPTRLVSLRPWWSAAARHGTVRVKRLALETPIVDAGGALRMQGRFRGSRFGPTTPVELTLWPWLGEWTKLSLEPRRHVAMTRGYFRRGHRVLDVLADRLAKELRDD